MTSDVDSVSTNRARRVIAAIGALPRALALASVRLGYSGVRLRASRTGPFGRVWENEDVMFPIAIIAGLLFGSADQYLGSIASMPWAASVSLLSAPWLVLPFCFGCTQRGRKSALVIGLVVTYAALLGYGAMTLSPMEGVHLAQQHSAIAGLLRSERRVLIGGLLTAPLYGLLGYYWRERRAWLSAALVAGAVCLEPFAESAVGRLPRQPGVWLAEVGVGIGMSIYFAVVSSSARRAEQLS